MGQHETPVEEYLVEQVKLAGGHSRKVQWVGRMGAPDRLIWWRFPVCAFVEVKGKGGRYEASQIREMARLSEQDWPVFTVWSKADVDQLIRDMQCDAGLLG